MESEFGGPSGDRHSWGSAGQSQFSLTPVRITLLYLALGILALVLFDMVLAAALADPLLARVQAAKGAIEVVLTAGLIYVLTARRESQLRRMAARVDRENRELLLLHRVLRHNLRNDLNVILAAVERIRAAVPEDASPADSDTLQAVFRRMEKYTADARRIRKVDEGPGHLLEFDLAALVREAVTPPGPVRARHRRAAGLASGAG